MNDYCKCGICIWDCDYHKPDVSQLENLVKKLNEIMMTIDANQMTIEAAGKKLIFNADGFTITENK